MHILLFILYSLIAGYLVSRLPFFRDSGIGIPALLLLFFLRVGTGLLHTVIAWRYYPYHGDIWSFYNGSFLTRSELQQGFSVFWTDVSRISYLPHNVLECIHILFNVFSFDNIYINTLFFDFFVFAGSIALFRYFMRIFRNDLIPSLTALLLPSTLYWTSCMYTEGILYAALGFFFFYLYRRNPLALLFLGVTIFFRPSLALSLLPALLLWLLYKYSSGRRRKTLLLSASIATLLLLCLPPVSHKLLSQLSERQSEFQQLTGNSRLSLPTLQPNWTSFWSSFPFAWRNSFLEPLPGSGGQPIYLIFSLELLAIWVLVLLALFSVLRRPSSKIPNPKISNLPSLPYPALAGLVFVFIGLLVIGYVVPFAGAIIRYRSIYLPFLLAPFLHLYSVSRKLE